MKLFLVFCIFIIQVACKPAARESEEKVADVITRNGESLSQIIVALSGEVLLAQKCTVDKVKSVLVCRRDVQPVKMVDWESAKKKVESLKNENGSAVNFFNDDLKKGDNSFIRKILSSESDVVFYRKVIGNGDNVIWEIAKKYSLGSIVEDFVLNTDKLTFIFQTLGEYTLKCGDDATLVRIKNKCSGKDVRIIQ
jgi:hypothetical protein